jgi:hypothetical protein
MENAKIAANPCERRAPAHFPATPAPAGLTFSLFPT